MSSFADPALPAPARDASSGAFGRLLKLQTALCAAVCAAWFGLAAGLRPLALPDEGRYVGIAWEMLRSGDWLVPTLNGAPFFHKPPLFYWMAAASMTVFGPTPWAARLGAVVATTAVATLLFAFVRRWQGGRAAWTTVAVLATTPLFYGSSQYANLDPLVAACIAVAVLCGADAALRREAGRPVREALLAAWVAAGCGVLAKGLIGIVLPILVLAAWAAATRRPGRLLRLLAWWPGWLAFLGITVPWFVAVQRRFPDFGHYFFVVQQFDRFTAATFNNAQPLWFYPALLALTAAPWSPWLLAPFRHKPWPRPTAEGLFPLMAAWAAVVTVFFSIPNSKPVGYILPALPPLAWMLAEAIGAVRRRSPGLYHWALPATAVLGASVCFSTVLALHFLQPKSTRAIASQLHARRLPGEPVFVIGNYYFDLPFYARLDAPVRVVDDWKPAEIAKDSWRRELVDAERFLPAGSPTQRLQPADLPSMAGAGGSAWIVGPATAPGALPWLAAQPLVFEHDGTALWHVAVPESTPAMP